MSGFYEKNKKKIWIGVGIFAILLIIGALTDTDDDEKDKESKDGENAVAAKDSSESREKAEQKEREGAEKAAQEIQTLVARADILVTEKDWIAAHNNYAKALLRYSKSNKMVKESLSEDFGAGITAKIEKIAPQVAKEKKAAEKAALMAEKKRLRSRKFVRIRPDALVNRLYASSDSEMEFETKFEGKYVRWGGKYERKGMLLVKFVAHTGRLSSMSCKDFDPAHDSKSFSNVKRWQKILVEGKLDECKKQLGKHKIEFVLTNCIARTK